MNCKYRYLHRLGAFSRVVIALVFGCTVSMSASAAVIEPLSGDYNACYVKFRPKLSFTNRALTLHDSGRLVLGSGGSSGGWTVADGLLRITLEGGGSYEGRAGNGVLALVSASGSGSELLVATRHSSKAASCYTMSGEVYNPFVCNTLCVTGGDVPRLSIGTGRTYWCDEAVRFMFKLDISGGSKCMLRGYPHVEKSGALQVGLEPPAGSGEKSADLKGATTEDGSLFFASGLLAAHPEKQYPVFAIGLKRQSDTAKPFKSRYRLTCVGDAWPNDAVLTLSENGWTLTSGTDTIGAGLVIDARNSIYTLKKSPNSSLVAMVDSTRRFAILSRNKPDTGTFAIGFLEDDK